MATKAPPAKSNPENGNGGSMVVRPQASVGALAEQQRATAEIQSALTVAAARPRDEIQCLDRIKNACQRIGLAEKAEYVYSRGGQEITGPTIDLLTVIANAWGNIQFGFRELAQQQTRDGSESLVECFAWDLETNSKRVVTFTVPHKRHTKSGAYNLTDPRDIYEAVANYAQRRVRACLEAVVPPDVIEEAVKQARETLKAGADVNPESIKKLVDAFVPLNVTREQIEARIGRRLDSMQPAQLVSMRRIYKSISDGMSKAGDWFETPDTDDSSAGPKSAAEAAKEALKGQSQHAEDVSQAEPDSAQNPPHQRPSRPSVKERAGWKADENPDADPPPESEAAEFEKANPGGKLFDKGSKDASGH